MVVQRQSAKYQHLQSGVRKALQSGAYLDGDINIKAQATALRSATFTGLLSTSSDSLLPSEERAKSSRFDHSSFFGSSVGRTAAAGSIHILGERGKTTTGERER